MGLPGRADTVRGFSASLVLIDEASRVTDEMYSALGPMRAATNGDLWLMSTPNGSQGFFWKVWMDGGAGWERILAPATECGRISAEFLAGELRARGERQYSQEYLCGFVDNGSQYFARQSVEDAMGDEEPVEV